MENANLLCEIGTEEIPAGYLPPAIEAIKKIVSRRLEENRVAFDGVEVYATPRRLVFLANGVAETQSSEEVEIKGPSVRAAYDGDGNPTKALEGFLRGNGLSPDSLYRQSAEKGEYLFAKKRMEAGKTVDLIPSLVETIVREIPFPKSMRWSGKKIAFPRPIAYFLILFNGQVVPFALDGIASSNRTRGHFVQFNRMIEIGGTGDYGKLLRENGVILDQNERRESIRNQLLAAAEELGGVLVEDEDLLTTVTFLTENPSVVSCTFDPSYLAIPDLVLITEMKEHQKYFAVRDKKGKLLPHFLVVSNNPPTEHVKLGNARVITARFNDAGFFFREDRKTKLANQVESLKSVLFHKELGTIYDKVDRMQFIAGLITNRLKLDDDTARRVQRAVLLCKADLNSAMVFEFPSLQGKMGRIYALLDGEDAAVADALDEHYIPRFQDDPLPRGMVSVTVSLAEKLDNLFGSFSVGNIPKGSADPYALRRQAGALVEMLLLNGIHLELDDLLRGIAARYKNGEALVGKILEFIAARARTLFTEKGFRYDEIDACLSIGYYDYFELFRRAESLNSFRKNENFSPMLLSFKRMNNILTAFRQKNADYPLQFRPGLLADPEEKGLSSFFETRKEEIGECIASGRYIELFGLLIEGKSIIDEFFDKVMVMAEDKAVRDNRLAMLQGILDPFKKLLDFSKISE